ncbi:MAG: hypothetical protein AAF611_14915 [Bacteroidota bacterium]
MELNKDLIIVHFQEGFFDKSNQQLKNTVKNNLQPLVDAALKTDIHLSFWEDSTVNGSVKSVIEIPQLGSDKVSRIEAPGGLNLFYKLHGPEVILSGGWFGACINGAIESIMTAFFNTTVLLATGRLTIRMQQNAVYKFSELLADMSNKNIKNTIKSAFDNSTVPSKPEVQQRGLRYSIIRSKTQETIEERVVVPAPNQPSDMFDIVFLLD